MTNPSLPVAALQNGGLPATPNTFEGMMQIATVLSNSTMIPTVYQKNTGNCFIAVEMATRMRVSPFTFMQKSFILNGKPSVEAQLLIAALNTSGLIKGQVQFHYEGEGMQRKCTASAEVISTGKTVSYGLKLVDALKVGNASKNANWQTIPDLMLSYRSATYLIRTYFPEVGLGMSTVEEERDMGAMVDVTPVERPVPPAEAAPKALSKGGDENIAKAAEAVVRTPEAEVLPPAKKAAPKPAAVAAEPGFSFPGE